MKPLRDFNEGKEYAEYGGSPLYGANSPPSIDAFIHELEGAAQAAPHMAHLLGRACFYAEQYQESLKKDRIKNGGNVRCTVNGQRGIDLSADGVTYTDIVEVAKVLADQAGKPVSFKGATVTYRFPSGAGGSLACGEVFRPVEGTVINCMRTDNA